MERCFAGNVSGANSQFLGFMGNIIEVVVMADYIRDRVNRGGIVDIFPSLTARDFFDLKDDRCEALAAFLKLRNPFIDEGLVRDFCRQRKVRDGDKSLVPDIITHDGDLREFYEVKSASPTGRKDGAQKIRNFCELNAGHGMPYCEDVGEEPQARPRGTAYSPQFKQVFVSGTWQGIPVRVSLQFTREANSLILYKYCVEISAETVSEAAFFLVLRIAIAMVILTRNPVLAVGVAAGAAAVLAPTPRSPLLQSVGDGGVNAAPDTRYVQLLLNDWRGRRDLPLLTVDGLHGRNTRDAIITFQQSETGIVDGRVDPEGPAILALERLHLNAMSEGVAGDFLEPGQRAELLDDASFTLVIAAPGNADEPGGGDLRPVDVLDTVRSDVQAYFQTLHDVPFDLIP
jgi:hypothetical protein